MDPRESAKWAKYHGVPEGLRATDLRFRGTVVLLWPDGSQATFRCAFYVEAKDEGDLVLFTEHCGYYKFPLRNLEHYFSVPTE
jgi:hypothetical protein